MSIEAVIGAVLASATPLVSAIFIFTKRAVNLYIKERDAVIKRVGVLEGDLKEAVTRADTAEKRAASLSTEVSRLNAKIGQNDKTIGELLQSLQERDSRLAETNEQLEKLQASYEKLNVRLDSLTQEREQLAREKQQAENRADDAERELDRTRAKLEGVQETHAALLAAIRVEPPGETPADPDAPDAMLDASVPAPKRETGEIKIEGKK